MRILSTVINVLLLLAALFMSGVTSTLGTLETQMKFTDMDRADCFNLAKFDALMLARHGSRMDVRGPEFAAWITSSARGPLQAALVMLILLALANIVMAWAGMPKRVSAPSPPASDKAP